MLSFFWKLLLELIYLSVLLHLFLDTRGGHIWLCKILLLLSLLLLLLLLLYDDDVRMLPTSRAYTVVSLAHDVLPDHQLVFFKPRLWLFACL